MSHPILPKKFKSLYNSYRSGHKLRMSKDRIFAIGGTSAGSNGEKINHVEEYDYKTNEWKIMEVKPLNRAWEPSVVTVPDSYFGYWADETCKH